MVVIPRASLLTIFIFCISPCPLCPLCPLCLRVGLRRRRNEMPRRAKMRLPIDTAFTYMHSLSARPGVRSLRSSKIREVANAGMGKEDVLAFWFGEPDDVTPAFIRRAGIEALERGETFYTQTLGIPKLREALAAYVSRLHRADGPDRVPMAHIAVT